MRKAQIAEWLLSLVIEPEQAASVTGDLLESGASRSVAWFWANVFQTWVGTVFRDFKARPIFVVGLGARGALVHVAILLLGFFFFVVADLRMPRAVALAFWALLVAMFFFLGPFLAGRWIAKRSHGSQVAICVAMTMFSPFVICGANALMFSCLDHFTHHQSPEDRRALLIWWEIVFLVPYLLGAIPVRLRRQIACTS